MELQKEIIGECVRGLVANNNGLFYHLKKQNASINGVSQIVLKNNYTQIDRICDGLSIDAIGISFDSHEAINLFYDTVANNNIFFKVSSKNYLLQNINLQLLIELDNKTKFIDLSHNMVVIKIPNLLIDRIELIGLEPDEPIDVIFDEKKLIKNISQVKLYTTNFLYDSVCRKNIVELAKTSTYDKYIQEILGGKLCNIVWEKKSDQFVGLFNVYSESFVKGFFIGSTDILNLREFKLKTYGYHKILYDKFCINKYCIKISDNLLFVPSDPCFSNKFLRLETDNFIIYPNSEILKTYTSCLDMQRYQIDGESVVRIEMTFDIEPKDLSIYVIGLNIIRYKTPTLKLERTSFLRVKQNDNILFENEIKHIKRPGYIGFWKNGILNQDLYCQFIPVENSAIEDQTKYIDKLLDLQKTIHNGDIYLGYDKCVLCNQTLKLYHYKYKGLTWPESYSHYLSEHNVKIDEELLQMLNEEK